jgi:DNA-binding SARP family transcriptional activator
MRFRVLGPLEVWSADRWRAVDAAKCRSLLAVLLLNANRAVPVDRIVAELWGDRLPASAASLVRGYVMRCRRLMDDPDGTVLVRRQPGYELRVGPDQVDVLRFETLLGRARQELAQQRYGPAGELAAQALDLWRGAAFVDVPPTPALDAETGRLDELRLVALEVRTEAELAQGRTGDLVAELRRLTASHPLRERFWAQLMQALHASGQQAEALDAYRQARDLLVEEYGVEPGEQLQSVHRRVLAGDEAPAGRPSPRELPRDLPSFVGRGAELARVTTHLTRSTGAPAIIAIHGPGGIGKSTLAIRAAYAVADTFPDGHLYVDLQGATVGLTPLAPLAVLTRFLRSLGMPAGDIPADVGEASASFRSLIAGRRVLLLLDNAADAAQVVPLLPATESCAALLTSRRTLATLDCPRVDLGVLPLADALGLLRRVLGDDRVSAEGNAAVAIVNHCGRLPLAVRIAAARLSSQPGRPLAALAERLADDRQRLDHLQVDDLALRHCFQVSYQELATGGGPGGGPADRAAARAFRALGLLRLPQVSVAAVAALLDADEPVAEAALDRLVAARLVEPADAVRYRVHDLLWLYAAEQAEREDPAEDRRRALRRLASWYLGSALRATNLLRREPDRPMAEERWIEQDWLDRAGFSDTQQAVEWLETERSNLVAAAGQLVDTEEPVARFAIALTRALQGYLPRGGYWIDYEMLGQLAYRTAARLGDRLAASFAQTVLAMVDEWTGRFDAAAERLEEALVDARETGQALPYAVVLSHLGHLHQMMGHTEPALRYYQDSLARLRELGAKPLQQGTVLNNIGEIHLDAGDADEAFRYLDESLRLRRAADDHLGEALTLARLGIAECLRQRYPEALRAFADSLTISRRTGHRLAEWEALLGRAEALLRTGRTDAAREAAEQALDTARAAGDPYQQALARYLIDRTGGHPGAPRLPPNVNRALRSTAMEVLLGLARGAAPC